MEENRSSGPFIFQVCIAHSGESGGSPLGTAGACDYLHDYHVGTLYPSVSAHAQTHEHCSQGAGGRVVHP